MAKQNFDPQLEKLEQALKSKPELRAEFRQKLRQDMIASYSTPITDSFLSNLMQKLTPQQTKYALLAIAAVLLFVIVGGLGVALRANHLSSNINYVDPNPVSYVKPGSYPESNPEVCANTTYTNTNLPGFSFEYSECDWELKGTENYEKTSSGEIAATDDYALTLQSKKDEGELKINIFGADGISGTCGTGEIVTTGNTYRTYDKVTGEYVYFFDMFEKESDEYKLLSEWYVAAQSSQPDFCGNQFDIQNTEFLAPEDLSFYGKGDKLDMYVTVEYAGNNPELADEVMKSLQVSGVRNRDLVAPIVDLETKTYAQCGLTMDVPPLGPENKLFGGSPAGSYEEQSGLTMYSPFDYSGSYWESTREIYSEDAFGTNFDRYDGVDLAHEAKYRNNYWGADGFSRGFIHFECSKNKDNLSTQSLAEMDVRRIYGDSYDMNKDGFTFEVVEFGGEEVVEVTVSENVPNFVLDNERWLYYAGSEYTVSIRSAITNLNDSNEDLENPYARVEADFDRMLDSIKFIQ